MVEPSAYVSTRPIAKRRSRREKPANPWWRDQLEREEAAWLQLGRRIAASVLVSLHRGGVYQDAADAERRLNLWLENFYDGQGHFFTLVALGARDYWTNAQRFNLI